MKLFMMTDLHINGREPNFALFKTAYEFALEQNPDVIFVLGDLCNHGYPNSKSRAEHERLTQRLSGIVNYEINRRGKHKKLELSPYELHCTLPIIAEEIYFRKKYPGNEKACQGLS